MPRSTAVKIRKINLSTATTGLVASATSNPHNPKTKTSLQVASSKLQLLARQVKKTIQGAAFGEKGQDTAMEFAPRTAAKQ